MEQQIEALLAHIKNDYRQWWVRSYKGEELPEHTQKMIREFNESIQVNYGKKYIKIVKDGSVWGFIVNVNNDKNFKYGDILKAASYNVPARNKARGNIMENDFSWVRWTGPAYL